MITSIGEILIDQFIDKNGTANEIGGAPFNVAVAIKRSGGNSSFIGSIGNDEFGAIIEEKACKMGLNNLFLYKYDEYKTTVAQVKLVNGERSFSFIRDGGADYHFSFPLNDFIYQSNIVHIGSLMLSKEEGRSFLKTLIPELKRRNSLVSFDINYREDIFAHEDIKSIYQEVIEQVDILKISEDELDIFGRAYIDSLKDKLICLSLGSKGSEYRFNELRGKVPTYKVKVMDTTGAGDAFLGAILSQLDGYRLNELDKEQLDEIFRFANAVGALTTLKIGAISPIPSKEEVITFMNDYK